MFHYTILKKSIEKNKWFMFAALITNIVSNGPLYEIQLEQCNHKFTKTVIVGSVREDAWR